MSMGRTSKYETINPVKQGIWKCGVYLRLSREDGDKLESDSIANQRKIIGKYLEKNPDLEIYDTYVDDGFSGTDFNRPNMARLLEDIKNRKVNCLIVKDLSRFGRNYHETGRYLEVVFPLLKLRFISVNDNIDSFKNPLSIKNSTVSFKNVMNDEYARDISYKIRSSLNAKRRRGEYIGTFALYGYIKDPNDHHKLIVDEEAAQNVKLIYNMFLSGVSIYNITQKLKELDILNPTAYKAQKGLCRKSAVKYKDSTGWSTQTVRRMLKNQIYTGKMVQGTHQTISHKIRKCVAVPKENYIVKEGTHEAIIDKETFERVQNKFKRDTWQAVGKVVSAESDMATGAIYVGYIRCADCGRAMQRSGYIKNGKSFYYFVCGSYLQWKQCSRHSIRVSKLNEIVLTIIQKYVDIAVETDKLLNKIQSQPADDIKSLGIKKKIRSCEAERDKLLKFQNDLYGDLKNEIITKEQYFYFKSEYAEKIQRLEENIACLNDELEQSNSKPAENSFVEVFKRYRNITILTRDMVEELIHMIYVEEGGGIRIEFNFKDAFNEAVKTLEEFEPQILKKSFITY